MKKRTVSSRNALLKADLATDERDELGHVAPFPIVGVGASAGGLEAFTQLLEALPLDTGMGFVLVQHLDPDHESALTQILSRTTGLPVHEIVNNEPVQPNNVYVIPRDKNLSIVKGVLKIQPRPRTRGQHRPIDTFFESLGQDRRERAVGIVLSGTGSDGTLGLEAIKAEGGITFAQDDSAKHDSMPRSAVAAGCVDVVLSPAQIGEELARYAKHPYVAGQVFTPTENNSSPEDDRAQATAHQNDQTPLPPGGRGTPDTGGRRARAEAMRGQEKETAGVGGAGDGYRKILLLLHNHSRVDFSLYRSTTIQRRITRRLVLSKKNTLSEYAEFLRGNANELDALYSDVLISVTSFFRNPETFDILQPKVLPELLKQRSDDPLRCWVLGCSTGQEAYSIAMAFVEAAEKAPQMRRLQIFATDLNDALLDKARSGLYAKSLADDIASNRLRRFFVEEEGGYRVNKDLREMVVFARQNIVSDPPFSRMDLISCRNLLIYLEPSLQKKAIPTFHYALRPGGFLLLGASESIGAFTDLFESVDRKHKIYSKKPGQIRAFGLPLKKESGIHLAPRSSKQKSVSSELPEVFPGELNAQREADRIAVNKFAPPGVLVNAQLQVLQFRGPTGAFLEPPVGKATFDVLKMAREGLMLPLRSAINKARKENKTVRKDKVRVERNGKTLTVSLEVIPLKNLPERCFLILFEETEKGVGRHEPPGSRAARGPRAAREEPSRIAELETELAELREYLQSTQEQHEAANEELQAANEEVQSANEELQSVNEELETSKEELESANEELTTVNEEMQNRNVEVNRLNNDLNNLQTSAKLSIVVVGRDLTIRRFTLEAKERFNLSSTDIGRSIGNIQHGLRSVGSVADVQTGTLAVGLERLAAQVIVEVREQEHEVLDKAGRWHSLHIRPYMTLDNKVDGAALVLVDIDVVKRSEHAIAVARNYAENIVETVREPLLVLDKDLKIERANPSFYRTFGVTSTDTIGKRVYELGTGQWDIPRLRELLGTILSQNASIEDFEVEHEFQSLGRRTMLLNARRIRAEQGEDQRILVAIEDITARKRFEGELQQFSAELSSAANRKNEFLAMLGHELRNPLSALANGLEILGQLPDVDRKRQELHVMMGRQTKRISALLDDLLDIERVISGKISLSKDYIDLTDVVRAAVETVTSIVGKRELILSLPLEKIAFVIGDRMRLAQVVENLLTNAAKYTKEEGRIALSLELEEEEVRIIVRDNGIGMSADFLPHVFEVFTQAPRPLDRAEGGLGLGLPLVERIVEMHGGRVTASSQGLGQGSEFVVTLPRVREGPSENCLGPEPDRPALEPGKIRPHRILVVDDEESARETLADLLEKDGHEILAVTDGPAAMEAVSTFAPDLVLLDLGLPGMDGYEVARRLRKEHDGQRFLLIAVTGYQSDATRLKEAGFDHHLIKPPDSGKLSAILTAWDSDNRDST